MSTNMTAWPDEGKLELADEAVVDLRQGPLS
jgi:hypothetical protein